MARAAWALWHDLASGNGASETRRPVEALEAGGRRSEVLVSCVSKAMGMGIIARAMFACCQGRF
jgi:hypothetical protein